MPASAENKFPTTDWSLVRGAGDTASTGQQASLALLLRRYQPALKRYLIHQRCVPGQQVDDVVQGFIADKVLEDGLIEQAREARGRFRNLLVRALENYLIDVRRRAQAARRAPRNGKVTLSLSENVAIPARPGSDPARAFDRAWAEMVLEVAVERARQKCLKDERIKQWCVFEYRVLNVPPGGKPPRYEELVSKFGFHSPYQASNALISCRRLLHRTLRSVLLEYSVDAGASLDEDVRELLRILHDHRADS